MSDDAKKPDIKLVTSEELDEEEARSMTISPNS